VAPPRGWRRLTSMEYYSAKLLREPLYWASAAAFVGVAVGLVGTFSWAAVMVVWQGPGILDWITLLGVPGYVLAALSLFGVPVLPPKLGRGSRALRIGTALLLAWLPLELTVELAYILYFALWSTKGFTSPVLTVASMATTLLGSAAMLSLGLGAFISGARRLGAMLLVLGVPGDLLFFSARNAQTGTNEISTQLAVTTTLLFGADLGVVEACLFALLGVMLLGGARGGRLRRRRRRTARRPCASTRWALGRTTPRWWWRWSPKTSATPGAACVVREV
jgi:hypothetical protein